MKLDLYSLDIPVPPKITENIRKFDREYISEYFYDPFTFDVGILSDSNSSGKILGAGVVRVVNEFKIVLNPELSDFKKARIIEILMKTAKEKAQCNEIIVEITQGGGHYINLLINHFDFQPTYGEVLRLVRE